jgi:S1-C subfamily serine protease
MKTFLLGRGAAAFAIALPLAVAPVAVPAAEAAHLVGSWGYPGEFGVYGVYSGLGAYGSYGSYGSYGGYGSGEAGQLPGAIYGYGDQGTTGQTASGQTDATNASATASTGLVLIDTDVDYGQAEAAGTGIVLSSDGIVVTNHHVVQGATSITVTTPAGQKYAASVIGYDATHDVAVLRLTGASGLATATTDASTVTTGEKVDAIGNAEGQSVLTDAAGSVLDPSTTIDVSGDDGSTEHLTDLIETSADVVPGDSGGALLDGAGKVVGMDVAASSGTAQTTGYAIPIARVLSIADQILAGQSSSTVTIGGKAALGVEIYTGTTEVIGVEAPSTQRSGLAAGDTITAVDGTAVSTPTALSSALSSHQPGDTVQLSWTDQSGRSESGSVTLVDGAVA